MISRIPLNNWIRLDAACRFSSARTCVYEIHGEGTGGASCYLGPASKQACDLRTIVSRECEFDRRTTREKLRGFDKHAFSADVNNPTRYGLAFVDIHPGSHAAHFPTRMATSVGQGHLRFPGFFSLLDTGWRACSRGLLQTTWQKRVLLPWVKQSPCRARKAQPGLLLTNFPVMSGGLSVNSSDTISIGTNWIRVHSRLPAKMAPGVEFP